MTVLVPAGYTALGIVIGALVEERLWHLLSRPLPRPWANQKTRYFFRCPHRAVARAWRYLAPGTVWRDAWRCWATGRWT